MIKDSILASIITLFLLIPMAFIGCSGGGGSDGTTESTGSASVQVLPSVYDFGIVTTGNSPAPLEVEIQNNGSATLNVSSIALLDTTNFDLYLDRGSNPCNTASPSIGPGGNCTVEVEFDPPPGPPASFLTNLRIRSNDPNDSSLNVPLMADQEAVDTLNVRINQVESDEVCPGPEVTAYVSVTDQGGYPVTGLTAADFTITETGGYGGLPNVPISYVAGAASLSVALVLDYSGSITDVQDNVDDMEESAADFVDQLGAGDEAEIIKFADDWAVVQSWQPGTVAGKDLLEAAIYAPYNNGRETDLYDAVVKAVDDTALRSKDRRAVIVITDGKDTQPGSALADVINDANTKGVPIFAVGLGDINLTILEQMADGTGGQVYESTTSDNLRTIYQQLAAVLFQDSYILTYPSGLGAGVTANLTIEATYSPGITGNDTKGITSCP
jgi:Ca-activated chloride channel family protein